MNYNIYQNDEYYINDKISKKDVENTIIDIKNLKDEINNLNLKEFSISKKYNIPNESKRNKDYYNSMCKSKISELLKEISYLKNKILNKKNKNKEMKLNNELLEIQIQTLIQKINQNENENKSVIDTLKFENLLEKIEKSLCIGIIIIFNILFIY